MSGKKQMKKKKNKPWKVDEAARECWIMTNGYKRTVSCLSPLADQWMRNAWSITLFINQPINTGLSPFEGEIVDKKLEEVVLLHCIGQLLQLRACKFPKTMEKENGGDVKPRQVQGKSSHDHLSTGRQSQQFTLS